MITLKLRTILVLALVFCLVACKATTIGAFDITNIELLAGSTANEKLVKCSTLEGTELYTHQNGYPIQPKNGDWSQSGSPYKGELLKTGAHAYECAIARVTVTRNPSVKPGTTWYKGDNVYLKVMAPHFCGNLHPGEDDMQPLTYIGKLTSNGQTVIVFDSVIVASECGVGPYSEELGEAHTVHFGQAPDIVGEPLKPAFTTNQLDCILVAGIQLNYSSCSQP